MSSKTNAVRLLETAGIRYELREYEVDEQDVSAEHVAETLGLPLKTLYKTLVLKGNKDPYIVAVIPGNAHLDLKKLAKASGNKNCEMLPMKDLLTVTGYIRGGCSHRNEKTISNVYRGRCSTRNPYCSKRRKNRSSDGIKSGRPG